MITYLYVKTHNVTKLRYFGKTTRNPFKYRGSGKIWLRHLRKHGNNVSTEIIGVFSNEEELTSCALTFSLTNNIVESDEWANLIVENGFDGVPVGNAVSEVTRRKISASLIGRPSPKSTYVMNESRETRSARKRQEQQGRVWITNGATDKKIKPADGLPDGWWLGRSNTMNLKPPTGSNSDGDNTRGKKIYNNGVVHKYFIPGQEPVGFVSGKMNGYQGGTGLHRKGKKYGKDKKETQTNG